MSAIRRFGLVAAALGLLGMSDTQAQTGAGSAATAKATFAGGCFWCVEEVYEEVDGVISATSGYIGGRVANPTYEQVSNGGTGHAEAVEVVYDPAKISYERLLQLFWRNIDPVAVDRQFCDAGRQYRAGIFYHDDAQRKQAEASKKAIVDSKRFDQPITTEIVQATQFYPAEEYHQDYYRKNPLRYKFYKFNCGRAQRLREAWGEAES